MMDFYGFGMDFVLLPRAPRPHPATLCGPARPGPAQPGPARPGPSSVYGMVKIVEISAEGFQNAKINFFERVADFSDVYAV